MFCLHNPNNEAAYFTGPGLDSTNKALCNEDNFKLISWLSEYLKWYFYGLATFWLRKGPKSVKQFKRY